MFGKFRCWLFGHDSTIYEPQKRELWLICHRCGMSKKFEL